MHEAETHKEENAEINQTEIALRTNGRATVPPLASLKGLSIRVKIGETEIEIPLDEISIDSRRAYPVPNQFFSCANCGARLPRSNDPITDHHIAMRHAREQCPRRHEAQTENYHLIAEFETQQLARQIGPIEANPVPRRPWWRRFF